MPELNADIPIIRCYVRGAFIGLDGLHECDLIGIRSEPGRSLQFHALLRAGALYSGLPIHAFVCVPMFTEDCDKLAVDTEPTTQQLWDCFSYFVAVHVFARLSNQSCRVRTIDGTEVKGVYLFTCDWRTSINEVDSSVLELPDERKSAHVIQGDDGLLYAMPNNRIIWEEPGFIREDIATIKKLTPLRRYYKCERSFITRHEDRMDYTAERTEGGMDGTHPSA